MSKRRNRRDAHVFDLSEALINNGKAMEEGPRKKKWTKHDLKTIKPLTPTQEEMFHAFFSGKHICAYGCAGTGKTYIALWLACNELVRRESGIERIIIVRSAVPTREQGFLPGELEEKQAVYEAPYKAMFTDFFDRSSTYDDMKQTGIVEFVSTSYLRGLTWDNAIVVVDEAQNMNFHELDTVVTRLGDNSRLIIAGDKIQTDLRRSKYDCSGIQEFIAVIEKMSEFSTIHFTHHDIVRSKFVKNWILARDGYA